MASEFQILSVTRDEATGTEITVSRMYQENGGKGIQVVVMEESTERFIEIWQAKDVVPHE